MTQLAFCHIPKCGGKTFRQILFDNFKFELHHKRLPYGYVPKEDDGLSIPDVIHGHFNYNFVAPFLKKDHLSFVWLRDPVERVVSQYNYWLYKDGINLQAGKQLRREQFSIQRFFRERDAERDGWIFMGCTLLGIDQLGTKEIPLKSIVKKAKENLDKFSFVGITENYDKDLERFHRKFGFDISYHKQNATPTWAKRAKLSDGEREEFKKLLQPEYEIYEHAKELGNG